MHVRDKKMNVVARKDRWLKTLDVERWDNNVSQCLVQSCAPELLFHELMQVFSIIFWASHSFNHLCCGRERTTVVFNL